MKTFDVHDVLTTLTASDAKDIINKPCYVCGDLEGLKDDVEHDTTDVLDAIEYGCSYPFKCSSGRYPYLLPVDKVKEIEEPKKWRAFNNHEELAKTLGIETKSLIGTKITWRNKGNGITVGQALIINVFSNKEESCITLGLVNYSMEKLFYELELNKDGEWQPFGVQE